MPGEAHTMPIDVAYVQQAEDPPKALTDRINERRCILFLGAGASLGAQDSAGDSLPSWWQMVQELLAELNYLDPQPRDVMDEMKDLVENGELLALSEWLDYALPRERFAQYLRQRLATADGSKVHEILAQRPFVGILTTNYDNLAEQYWSRAGWTPFVVAPHMSTAEITQASSALATPTGKLIPVIKPHGTWERPESIVFGPAAYRQIMFNNDQFRQFMLRIFSEYTVLFVGLSFKDPNLQSLLQWVRTITKGETPLHYATMENRGPIFKRYFREHFGIRLLTYPVTTPRDHSACQMLLDRLPVAAWQSGVISSQG